MTLPPLGMTALHQAALWYELYNLEVRHWHDVNHNRGETAHELYTDDGLFSVGETRHEGRTAIQQFYAWRRTRGARLARHLVSNLNFTLDASGKTAWVTGVITLYAADGEPILESKSPTMIADLMNECHLGDDLQWRFKRHVLVPLFRGEGQLNSAANRHQSPT